MLKKNIKYSKTSIKQNLPHDKESIRHYLHNCSASKKLSEKDKRLGFLSVGCWWFVHEQHNDFRLQQF